MRTLRILSLLLGVLVAGSCGDSTGPDTSHEGTYDLESINASPLPYDILGVVIVSAEVTLRNDGTFTSTATSRYQDPTTGQVVTDTDTEGGTYTRTGNTFRFTPSSTDEEPFDATYDGATLTVDAGLFVAVYRKR